MEVSEESASSSKPNVSKPDENVPVPSSVSQFRENPQPDFSDYDHVQLDDDTLLDSEPDDDPLLNSILR